MQFKVLYALAATAVAYPAISTQDEERSIIPDSTNAGFFPNKGFDAKDQYVDVRPGSGHEFKMPKSTDIRGPCPGLNAAANHAFTSRTGVFDYEDTTEGLSQAFSLAKDFSNILFVFSVFNSGSVVDMKWSIGGPMPTTTLGLLGKGLGLSNSHNKYEGDSSPGRGDAYLHHGDAHSLNLGNFQNILKQTGAKDNYDFPSMRKHIVFAHEYSIKHNPYVFYGPNFFVAPIAHEFVTAFMSNHSADNIGGKLTKKTLMSFFAVKEHKNGKLEWMKGADRIPDNWYKRPSSNPYGVLAAVNDFQLTVAENPEIGDLGGNTGKPNTFAGLHIEDLTSGVFTSKNILKGHNLGCFAFQGLIFGTPGFAEALLNKATAFSKFADKITKGAISKLGCPELTGDKYKGDMFKKYPGFTFKQPRQPATPY